MMKLSSAARQFAAHMSKKEFKAACKLFTEELMPGHAYDPYVSKSSMQVLHRSSLSKLLAMSMAPFKTVQLVDLQSMLAVDKAVCLEMVKEECLRQRQWLIDEHEGVVVRKTFHNTPRDVFERLVHTIHDANVGALMVSAQKEAWMDAGASGDKGSRPAR
jgi:hypothetical protein